MQCTFINLSSIQSKELLLHLELLHGAEDLSLVILGNLLEAT